MIDIDGSKLLEKLGITENGLAYERVSQKMMELGAGELTKIIIECQIGNNPTDCNKGADGYILEIEENIMGDPEILFYSNMDFGTSWSDRAMLIEKEQYTMEDALSPEEIKRKLKYCKNPMGKIQLQRELTEAYKDRKRGRV